MAKVLIATIPVRGHVAPFLPVARMLRQCGHEVAWYTGMKYSGAPRAADVVHLPYRAAQSFDDADFDLGFPERSKVSGLAQLRFDMKHIFIDATLGQLEDLRTYSESFQPTLVLADPAMLGALMLSELHAVPCGMIGVLPLVHTSPDVAPFGMGLSPGKGTLARMRNQLLTFVVQHTIFGSVQAHWNAVRNKLGLASTKTWWMDAALAETKFWIQPTVPGFEYPRSDLQPNVHFSGILPSKVHDTPDDPPYQHELDGRKPVVHVTQGTLANAEPRLIRPALEALANEDVLVVVSTGNRDIGSLNLGAIPRNARVSMFLNYERFLPSVSLMVTNGGYGGVQLALKHGVPLIVAGKTEDKPEVAARVAWSGAGIDLKTDCPSPRALQRAARQLLSDPSYRENARRLAREYACYDALNTVRELVEKWGGAPSSPGLLGNFERASA